MPKDDATPDPRAQRVRAGPGLRGAAGGLCYARVLLLVLAAACSPSARHPDPPDWRDLEVVDVHAHLGTYGTFDLRLGTLLGYLERSGTRLALISNLDGSSAQPTGRLGPSAANQTTLETVRRHSGRLRGLLWANPGEATAAELERFVAATMDESPTGERVFVGLKLHPDLDRFLADDRRVDPFLELCRRHRLVAVFHAGPPGSPSAPERIAASARRHPTVPVILYHMGADGFDGGAGVGQEAAIAIVEKSLAAGDADLYLETAQTPAEWIVEAVRRLGQDRVLFGTDATYYGAAHFESYAPIVSRLRQELPPPALAAVMGGNARRLFRLEGPPAGSNGS
jgi:uncharacterized protein